MSISGSLFVHYVKALSVKCTDSDVYGCIADLLEAAGQSDFAALCREMGLRVAAYPADTGVTLGERRKRSLPSNARLH